MEIGATYARCGDSYDRIEGFWIDGLGTSFTVTLFGAPFHSTTVIWTALRFDILMIVIIECWFLVGLEE
jgi:hypothetical protein